MQRVSVGEEDVGEVGDLFWSPLKGTEYSLIEPELIHTKEQKQRHHEHQFLFPFFEQMTVRFKRKRASSSAWVFCG